MAQRDRCFSALAKLAMEHHIHLTIYIHPYHADFLDMLDYFGFGKALKIGNATSSRKSRSSHPDETEIRVIDFSGYNEFTTEAVPDPGDTKSEMRWYWEPGHYKSALGEHILERIVHGRTRFGRVLTAANIESALRRNTRGAGPSFVLPRDPHAAGRPRRRSVRGLDPACFLRRGSARRRWFRRSNSVQRGGVVVRQPAAHLRR